MPTTFILLNSDLGSDVEIIKKIKEILDKEGKSVQYEVQGVYGVYDIVVKISSDSMDHLRNIITNKIRKIDKVYSTLTMMVIEEQEQ
ncbi:MAG TPA: Lrp/AsnC family transcriptional regulator [Nitrosopumilaceae archaeon]|jgi:DNA-binding Lrp family transcriptional regulator|nr:Lrp/AsnC family transcriptional regulator [Nitrosopumilaceae archaeon]